MFFDIIDQTDVVITGTTSLLIKDTYNCFWLQNLQFLWNLFLFG